jgi:hypothetical protein
LTVFLSWKKADTPEKKKKHIKIGVALSIMSWLTMALIVAVLTLGYLYYRFSGGSAALAAIGLIAFVGMAQVLPVLVGGLYWRGATKVGAVAGLLTGFAVWAYTLYLPSFGPGAALSVAVFEQGPGGIGWLRPQALFGVEGMDPLLHALFWSMVLNTVAFCAVSLFTFPGPVERMQGAAFVNVFDAEAAGPQGWARGRAEPEALLVMTQRILGKEAALAVFAAEARGQGKEGYLPDATPDNHVVTTFEKSGKGTLMTMRMTLPDGATRAAMLATGMEHGMEASYARLEADLNS